MPLKKREQLQIKNLEKSLKPMQFFLTRKRGICLIKELIQMINPVDSMVVELTPLKSSKCFSVVEEVHKVSQVEASQEAAMLNLPLKWDDNKINKDKEKIIYFI